MNINRKRLGFCRSNLIDGSPRMKMGAGLLLALLLGLTACSKQGSSTASATTDTPKTTTVSRGEELKPPPTEGGTTLTGQVFFKGTSLPLEPPTAILLDKTCSIMHGGKPPKNEEFVLNPNGTLRWVFVYVKEGIQQKYQPSPKPVVLDQKSCLYTPHVFGVMVGQPVEIQNNDPIVHNVRAFAQVNPEFNLVQATQGEKGVRVFTEPEVMIKFKCDVHPWMASYCGVLEHPFFAVTGEDGTFTIPHLPPGTYTIEAWHEVLGTRTAQVTIKEGETEKVVDFTFRR